MRVWVRVRVRRLHQCLSSGSKVRGLPTRSTVPGRCWSRLRIEKRYWSGNGLSSVRLTHWSILIGTFWVADCTCIKGLWFLTIRAHLWSVESWLIPQSWHFLSCSVGCCIRSCPRFRSDIYPYGLSVFLLAIHAVLCVKKTIDIIQTLIPVSSARAIVTSDRCIHFMWPYSELQCKIEKLLCQRYAVQSCASTILPNRWSISKSARECSNCPCHCWPQQNRSFYHHWSHQRRRKMDETHNRSQLWGSLQMSHYHIPKKYLDYCRHNSLLEYLGKFHCWNQQQRQNTEANESW